jgi:hypothetical protein
MSASDPQLSTCNLIIFRKLYGTYTTYLIVEASGIFHCQNVPLSFTGRALIFSSNLYYLFFRKNQYIYSKKRYTNVHMASTTNRYHEHVRTLRIHAAKLLKGMENVKS